MKKNIREIWKIMVLIAMILNACLLILEVKNKSELTAVVQDQIGNDKFNVVAVNRNKEKTTDIIVSYDVATENGEVINIRNMFSEQTLEGYSATKLEVEVHEELDVKTITNIEVLWYDFRMRAFIIGFLFLILILSPS